MPFSVRQIAQDDKLCHQVNLEVLQEVYPRETVEQVLSDCHAWEKREKALSMVAIVYLVIALTLFPRLTVGGVLRRLASGARFLWPDPNEAVATEGAICQRRLWPHAESLSAIARPVLAGVRHSCHLRCGSCSLSGG